MPGEPTQVHFLLLDFVTGTFHEVKDELIWAMSKWGVALGEETLLLPATVTETLLCIGNQPGQVASQL